MKHCLFLLALVAGLTTSAIEVVFNYSGPSEVKFDESGEVAFLRFGIEEAYLNDTKVIVMTEGMYKSLTNKINMLTYWCQKSYKAQTTTLQGLESWHGKKKQTIVTNGTYYIEFSDGFIYEDKDGKIDPKSRFENMNKHRPAKVNRPINRTVKKNPPLVGAKPVVKHGKMLGKSRRVTDETDVSVELKNIRKDRKTNISTTNEVTIIYGPGRKVIDEK